MKTYAKLRNLGVPALKVRRFASTIKGEQVSRAEAILGLQSSPTCQALHKLLKSAIANAQNNNELAPENLVVSNVMVDQGPSMKRIKPRARGRAYRILKRSSHVTIELDLKKGLTMDMIQAEREDKDKATKKRAPRKKAETKTSETKKTETKKANTTKAKAGGDEKPKDTAKKTTKTASKKAKSEDKE